MHNFTQAYIKGWTYVLKDNFVRTNISWMHRYRKGPNRHPGYLFNFRVRGWLIPRRRVKERGVPSHNCNKLTKTNVLLQKISREFKKSRISTPSWKTDMFRPSKIYIALSNLNIDVRIRAQGFVLPSFGLSLSFLWICHWKRWNMQTLLG